MGKVVDFQAWRFDGRYLKRTFAIGGDVATEFVSWLRVEAAENHRHVAVKRGGTALEVRFQVQEQKKILDGDIAFLEQLEQYYLFLENNGAAENDDESGQDSVPLRRRTRRIFVSSLVN